MSSQGGGTRSTDSTDSTDGGGRGPSSYVFLGLMVLIGSTTALSAKFAVRELPLPLIPLVRFGVAGLCLLPFALRRGAFGRMIRQDWHWLLPSAIFCVGLNQLFFLSGTRLAPTTHVGLIYATNPLFVLLIACAMRTERLRADRLLGIAASVLGVVVIAAGNLRPSAGAAGASGMMGDLLLVGAVVTWGAYMAVSRPLIRNNGAITALAGTFLVGTVLDLPVSLLALDWDGSALPLGLGAIERASASAWWSLAYLSLVVTVFALAFQNLAISRLDASEVATFGNLAPILTVVWGHLVLGEPITPTLIVGGTMTIGGILWTIRPRRSVASAHRLSPVAIEAPIRPVDRGLAVPVPCGD